MDYLDLLDISKFEIKEEVINSYQIILLPENYGDTNKKEELFNSIDSVNIYKELKSCDIKCADFTDFGIDVGFLERRDSDIWLGVIWVLDKTAFPILVSIVSGILLPFIKKERKKKENKPLPKVHIEIKVKKGQDNSTSFKYSGDATSLEKILKSISDVSEDADKEF